MLQLTSRRLLRELDEAPRGNNLQYILKCPCIPFFGNQGLHNEIMLEGNRGRSRVMCEGFSYSIQWQDERSWRRMVHRNIYTRKETHCRFPYWIYGLSKQGTDRQSACNIFAEKERKQRNYQSHNGISTNSSSQEPRTVEGGNHSSRTRIWVDQYSLWLQDRFRNNLWRNGQTNGNRMTTE